MMLRLPPIYIFDAIQAPIYVQCEALSFSRNIFFLNTYDVPFLLSLETNQIAVCEPFST